MRIISGRSKGLKLSTPSRKSLAIRPTSDRSREALFSILGERVVHSRILDLFAGTGALGLEALSRGGDSAIFADNGPQALKLLKENIQIFKNSITPDGNVPTTTIVKCDLSKGLQSLKRFIEGGEKIFHIIFLDPPYDKSLALLTLKHLDKHNLLTDDGIIVAEDRANVLLPPKFQNFEMTQNRKYGDTGFSFYEKT